MLDCLVMHSFEKIYKHTKHESVRKNTADHLEYEASFTLVIKMQPNTFAHNHETMHFKYCTGKTDPICLWIQKLFNVDKHKQAVFWLGECMLMPSLNNASHFSCAFCLTEWKPVWAGQWWACASDCCWRSCAWLQWYACVFPAPLAAPPVLHCHRAPASAPQHRIPSAGPLVPADHPQIDWTLIAGLQPEHSLKSHSNHVKHFIMTYYKTL